MKPINWKMPAVYTAIGAIIGSSLMVAPAALADQNFRYYWAKFAQNGQQAGSAQAIQYGGTNYFGIYYLQQLLKKDGMDVTWNGSELQLNGVPVQQATTLSVSGNTASNAPSSPLLTDAITVNGVTYVPLSSVQAMLSKAGVHLNQGDGQDPSGTSTSSMPTISAESVQSITEKLKEAASKLSKYQQIASSLQLTTSTGPFGHGDHGDSGKLRDALHKLTTGMEKLQSAYDRLTALATLAANGTGSSTTGGSTTGGSTTGGSTTGGSTTGGSTTGGSTTGGSTTGGSTTGGSTTGGSTTGGSTTGGSTTGGSTTGGSTTGGSTTGGSTTGGSTTGGTPASSADIATQLQTIAAAINQDLKTINSLALASFGNSITGYTSTSSGSSSSGTTSTGTTAPDLSSVISDIQTQIQQLNTISSQLSQSGSGSSSTSQDN